MGPVVFLVFRASERTAKEWRVMPSVAANVIMVANTPPPVVVIISSTPPPAAPTGWRTTRKRPRVENKLTRGAATRKHISPLVIADVVEAARDLKVGGSEKLYDILSRDFGVPVGNLSRWLRNGMKYTRQAGLLQASMLLGVKTRRLAQNRKFYSRVVSQHPNHEAFEKNLEARVKVRQWEKRGVSLPWLQKIVRTELKAMAANNMMVCVRGKPLVGSIYWCWHWLVKNGWMSRRLLDYHNINSTSVFLCYYCVLLTLFFILLVVFLRYDYSILPIVLLLFFYHSSVHSILFVNSCSITISASVKRTLAPKARKGTSAPNVQEGTLAPKALI